MEEGSVAERSGLRPGDTILEVNGTPFTAIGHEEALKVNLFDLFCNIIRYLLIRLLFYSVICVLFDFK